MFLVLLGFFLALRFDLSLAQPKKLSVLAVQDLRFGIVIAGTDKTVSPTDNAAAEFKVTAPESSVVLVQFDLPSSLSLNGSGSPTLLISFGNESAGWAHEPWQNPTLFNPSIPQEIPLVQSYNFYVWVGGTVKPLMNQQAGKYSGSLTIIVTLK